MLLLTGEFRHTVDQKGRVLIPGKLRRQIDAVLYGCNLYIVMGPNGILCLYPEKCFRELVHSLAPDTDAPDEAVAFERMSFAMANKVELDSQGRLLLTESLRSRAGLKDEIMLVGVHNCIELWNVDRWDSYVTDHMTQFQEQMSQARHTVLQKQNEEL